MSRMALMPWFWACIGLLVGGCADNAMVLKGRLNEVEQRQTAMTHQNQQLQDRVNQLSRDNENKEILVAQAVQQTKLSEDQLALMRKQCESATSQLTRLQAEKENSDRQYKTLTATMQRQGGVTINSNNSFLQALPAANIPGVAPRREGDVICVEIPANTLFDPGTARLRPGAANLIINVAADIVRLYPDQIIGVEGHTDNDPVAGGVFRNNQELSASRAMAVYDVLVTRTRLQGDQLFVTGHGPIKPLVSNGEAEGKQRNRRIELVVYPDRKK
jgi:flagellar motor protein MotB